MQLYYPPKVNSSSMLEEPIAVEWLNELSMYSRSPGSRGDLEVNDLPSQVKLGKWLHIEAIVSSPVVKWVQMCVCVYNFVCNTKLSIWHIVNI